MVRQNKQRTILKLVPFLIPAVLVFILLGSVLFGGKAFLPGALISRVSPWNSTSAADSGDTHWNVLTWDSNAFYYPPRVLLGRAYRSGEIPLWNPYQMCGMPLLADSQSAVLYPPNLLYAVLPPDRVIGLLAALHLFAAAAFMYLFLKGLKLGGTASAFGSIAFMLSGFVITWLQTPTFLSVGVWLPLILHLSRLAHERRSIYYAAASGVTIALSLLGGHPQIAFYCILAVGLYWIYLSISSRCEFPARRSLLLAFMAFAIGFALAAPQLLPTAELAALSHRGHPPTAQGYAGYSSLAMPLINLVTLLVPDFFGNPSKGTFWGANEYAEFCTYVGILPLLLLPLAFAGKSNRRKYAYFFCGLAVLALLMALGAWINRLFYFGIPGFTRSGSPARVLFLFTFSISVLGAIGMDRVLDDVVCKRSRTIRPLLLSGFVLSAIGAILLAHIIYRLSGKITAGELISQLQVELRMFFAYFVAGLGLILLILTGRMSRKLGSALVLCVLAADLLSFGMWYNPTCRYSMAYPHTELTDFLKADSGYSRIMPVNEKWSLIDFPEAVLPPNSASLYGLFDVQGYDSLYPVRYKTLLDAAAGRDSCPPENGNMVLARNPSSAVYDLLGVRWVISTRPIGGERKLMDGCYLYKNTDPLPRAFIVHSIELAGDDETLRRIVEKETNLRAVALVTADDGQRLDPWKDAVPSAKYAGISDTVDITKYTFNTVTLKAQTSKPGVLVLTDQYYPGWEAYVDGKSVPIGRADYDFRAIPLTPGNHQVLFRYEPRSFRKGLGFAWVALLTLAVLGIIGIVSRNAR